MKNLLVGIISFGLSVNAFSSSFDLSFKEWTDWLKTYAQVQGPVTAVNYKEALKKRAVIDRLAQQIENLDKATYQSWDEKDQLAFLINAYNVFTVKLILDHYPVKSIKDIGSLFKSAWKQKFFKLFGEEETLDGIEHERIRKNFKEPRIHFAVVCASKGCPALKGEAYTGKKLDEQLEESLRLFLKDTNRNRWESSKSTLFLSKIFKWYGDDFKGSAGTVQAFVASRMGNTPEEIKKIQSSELEFLEYDWSLNETPEKAL
ncbi:DUF547 domain-containing protein [bacterium]|nr:DUF547 domain-containing protein [bacterium]